VEALAQPQPLLVPRAVLLPSPLALVGAQVLLAGGGRLTFLVPSDRAQQFPGQEIGAGPRQRFGRAASKQLDLRTDPPEANPAAVRDQALQQVPHFARAGKQPELVFLHLLVQSAQAVPQGNQLSLPLLALVLVAGQGQPGLDLAVSVQQAVQPLCHALPALLPGRQAIGEVLPTALCEPDVPAQVAERQAGQPLQAHVPGETLLPPEVRDQALAVREIPPFALVMRRPTVAVQQVRGDARNDAQLV
jgi:hypothetical protein